LQKYWGCNHFRFDSVARKGGEYEQFGNQSPSLLWPGKQRIRTEDQDFQIDLVFYNPKQSVT
jgi:hypothetical protein